MAKSAKSEIDDLFAKVKKVKPDNNKTKIKPKTTSVVQTPKDGGSSGDLLGKGKKTLRKFTEEGWPIYTEEELKIGKGGDTALCPFDCECCF